MESLLTPQNIVFVIGIIGTIFTIFNYFRNPQIELDKKTALEEKEGQSRDALIKQRLDWQKEVNAEKFSDMTKRLDDVFALAQNHIHTVDEKLTMYIEVSNARHIEISNKLTQLSTIINERMPKK